MENKSGEAKVQKVKNWSPVWIFPIVTALIGAWILFYHYSHQGPEVTLITTNAEGIVPRGVRGPRRASGISSGADAADPARAGERLPDETKENMKL